VSVDEDDLTTVKNRIHLTWHQKNMISVYKSVSGMVLRLARNLQSTAPSFSLIHSNKQCHKVV